MADLGAVTQAATAILAALWQRERTGEDQFIAVSGEFSAVAPSDKATEFGAQKDQSGRS